jgi:hypothetical protein
LVLAVGWHTLADAVAVFTLRTWGVYVTEGFGVLIALISLAIVFALYRADETTGSTDSTMPQKAAVKVTEEDLRSHEETEDRLEDSRYL